MVAKESREGGAGEVEARRGGWVCYEGWREPKACLNELEALSGALEHPEMYLESS